MNILQYISYIPLCYIIKQLGPTNYYKFNNAYKQHDTDLNYPIDKYIKCCDGGAIHQLEIIANEYINIPYIHGLLQLVDGPGTEQYRKTIKNTINKFEKLLASYSLEVLEEITKATCKFMDIECYSKLFKPSNLIVDSPADISTPNISRFKKLLYKNLPRTKQINYINTYITDFYMRTEVKEIMHKYNISYDELSIENQHKYNEFTRNANPRSIIAKLVNVQANIFARLGKWLFG